MDNFPTIMAAKITEQPKFNSASGYGSKIPTKYMVKLEGDKKYRRVYATCWGSIASHWVLVLGKKIFVSF